MITLSQSFPMLAIELAKAPLISGSKSLAIQLDDAIIEKVTFVTNSGSGYIFLKPARVLNAIELNIIGISHGKTISLNADYWINIDLDNFDRLTGIEVLGFSNLEEEFRKGAANLNNQSRKY